MSDQDQKALLLWARAEAYRARNGFRPKASAMDSSRIENLIMLVKGALTIAARPIRTPVRNREFEAAQRIARQMGKLARQEATR